MTYTQKHIAVANELVDFIEARNVHLSENAYKAKETIFQASKSAEKIKRILNRKSCVEFAALEAIQGLVSEITGTRESEAVLDLADDLVVLLKASVLKPVEEVEEQLDLVEIPEEEKTPFDLKADSVRTELARVTDEYKVTVTVNDTSLVYELHCGDKKVGGDVWFGSQDDSRFDSDLEALVIAYGEPDDVVASVPYGAGEEFLSLGAAPIKSTRKVLAYMRASTDKQDAERARGSLEAFVAAYSSQVDGWYVENESGTKSERPELNRLIEDAEQGDILLIEKLDRLTRLPFEEWKDLKHRIQSKGIRIVVEDQVMTHSAIRHDVDAIQSAVTQALSEFMLDLGAAMARDWWETTKIRQAQGIAKAKAAGKYQGRQKNNVLHTQVRTALQQGLSWTAIQESLGCSRATVARASRDLKADQEKLS